MAWPNRLAETLANLVPDEYDRDWLQQQWRILRDVVDPLLLGARNYELGVVGTEKFWTDGSTIWRKVLELDDTTSPTGDTFLETDATDWGLGTADLAVVVSADLLVIESGVVYPLPLFDAALTDFSSFTINVSGNKLVSQVLGSPTWTSATVRAVVEYTTTSNNPS
jgi:hypothetical protein